MLNSLKSIKSKIHSLETESVSFLDIYKPPYHLTKYGTWVYDQRENFVFQFERNYIKGNYIQEEIDFEQQVLRCLSTEEPYSFSKDYKFTLNKGVIYKDEVKFITIRGWGNLTGVGSYNLPTDKAERIQDTFTEWLLKKLNTFNA